MPQKAGQHKDGVRPRPERPIFRPRRMLQTSSRHGAGTAHNHRCEDIILRALPSKYERVRLTSYDNRGFGLDGILHMAHTVYINNISGYCTSKPNSGRGVVMQLTGENGSDVQCNYWEGVGHLLLNVGVQKHVVVVELLAFYVVMFIYRPPPCGWFKVCKPERTPPCNHGQVLAPS